MAADGAIVAKINQSDRSMAGDHHVPAYNRVHFREMRSEHYFQIRGTLFKCLIIITAPDVLTQKRRQQAECLCEEMKHQRGIECFFAYNRQQAGRQNQNIKKDK